MIVTLETTTFDFNPLPPHGGRHFKKFNEKFPADISIRSLHTEGDYTATVFAPFAVLFQSTPSTRRETVAEAFLDNSENISIHSLHTEGDIVTLTRLVQPEKISIHSLHTEGDFSRNSTAHFLITFQSTPSTRRETKTGQRTGSEIPHFNPLPPHGGRPACQSGDECRQGISIHSLHTEGDLAEKSSEAGANRFQSTPSTRRETSAIRNFPLMIFHFNPLPPHGGRRVAEVYFCLWLWYFNPLPPHGGRRSPILCLDLNSEISIHSLHTEGDADDAILIDVDDFISIHSLHTEGDVKNQVIVLFPVIISIHSLHTEGDRKTAQESVFHFAYPCTILQKRMQKTTFCTRKNDFFRKKGEKFGAKPPASFCAPMIRTDIFPQTSLTESAALPCLWFPLHRYVPPSTDNDFPGNKTAGCPFLYQSPVPADA